MEACDERIVETDKETSYDVSSPKHLRSD